MNSPNCIPDEARVLRCVTVVPASSVRIVKVSSAEALKSLGLEYANLKKGRMEGGNIYIDNRTLLWCF
jgi:hypothetical protein